MKKYLAVLLGSFFLFAGCMTVQLTDEAKKVEYVTKQEAPKEYKLIGPVEFGTFEATSSVQNVIHTLLNKTAAMNGDFLVIDVIEKHYGAQGGSWYTGNGRAYKK